MKFSIASPHLLAPKIDSGSMQWTSADHSSSAPASPEKSCWFPWRTPFPYHRQWDWSSTYNSLWLLKVGTWAMLSESQAICHLDIWKGYCYGYDGFWGLSFSPAALHALLDLLRKSFSLDSGNYSTYLNIMLSFHSMNLSRGISSSKKPSPVPMSI